LAVGAETRKPWPMVIPPCRLYLITPPRLTDLPVFARILDAALSAGDVAALQIRLKAVADGEIAAAVSALAPIAAARGVAVILNDRPDLAARLGCDGVHIGQDDAPYTEARRLMGKDRIVGVTCHDSRHLAMEAAEAGADYVAFGAFFDTTTKQAESRADLEILELWQEAMTTPCVAIGGIGVDNCRALVAAGADFLAVSAGVWAYPQGPAAAVAAFNKEIAQGVKARTP
jgi:thiamine-phosphate pyrophosphorylase